MILGDVLTLSLDAIGLRNRIDQTSRGHNYLHKYESLFAQREVRNLAMVLGSRPIAIANTFAEFLPEATVSAITYTEVPEADMARLRPNVRVFNVDKLLSVHRALATIGPVDVLVEDSRNRKSMKREIFRQFFPHVKDGGLYVAEDLHAGYIASLVDDDKEELWQFVSRLLAYKSSQGGTPEPASADEQSLASSIGKVEFDGKFLVVEHMGHQSVKLRHDETNAILQARYGDTWGKVLAKRDAMTYASDALAFVNNPELADRKLRQTITVPDLYVREYNAVTVGRRQCLQKDSLLLPDTFRLGLVGRLKNTALKNFNHHFARSPFEGRPVGRLSGQYYHLDLEYNTHFGHFMTEAIPRLYGWDDAKAANPELKLLISSSRANGPVQPYQMEILQAYGIDEEDIHVISEPMVVDSLIAAMPLFHNAQYVHPDLRDTFDRLSKSLVADSSPRGARIFISRKPGMWRECLNMDALEAVFIERGFEVVYPEEMTLREQATVFAHADAVAGYIGSSLYSTMFNTGHLDLITFVNTAYQSTNEHLISTTRGHKMHMFWCEDIHGNRLVDAAGRSLAKTNYDYAFDFEKDGPALNEVLDKLDK